MNDGQGDEEKQAQFGCAVQAVANLQWDSFCSIVQMEANEDPDWGKGTETEGTRRENVDELGD